MLKTSLPISGLLCLMLISASHADVLSIADPRYEVPNSPSGILRPTQGMNMQTVTARFGEPEQKLAAVGEPPITRWVYPQFEVFFEHQLVIHSVVRRDRLED
ncbi:hypothetical protein [Methylophaga lonarensis]|uniref:hypothetical protein n=1 Tax=Methylophaga lonarensis TaxID=999151 RepID=UPI003D2A9F20